MKAMDRPNQPKEASCGKLRRDHLFIYHGDGEYIRVAINDIAFLRASRNYCEIHIRDKRTFIVSVPMLEVIEKIPSPNFVRFNRSYIVNLDFVVKIIGNQVELMDGTLLIICRTYRKDIQSNLIFIGSRKRNK